MTVAVVLFVGCAVIGGLIGGLLRQNPVAGFMLGLGYGPIGLILAYFLEGDDRAAAKKTGTDRVPATS